MTESPRHSLRSRRLRTSCVLAGLPLLAAGTSFGFELAGQEPPQQAVEARELPDSVTVAMVEAGREIFVGKGACLTCHGEEGEGTPIGPPLVDHEWVHIDGTYPAIVALVTEGVAEPRDFPMAMLPRAGTEITDEELRAVAAYVWFISRPE